MPSGLSKPDKSLQYTRIAFLWALPYHLRKHARIRTAPGRLRLKVLEAGGMHQDYTCIQSAVRFLSQIMHRLISAIRSSIDFDAPKPHLPMLRIFLLFCARSRCHIDRSEQKQSLSPPTPEQAPGRCPDLQDNSGHKGRLESCNNRSFKMT